VIAVAIAISASGGTAPHQVHSAQAKNDYRWRLCSRGDPQRWRRWGQTPRRRCDRLLPDLECPICRLFTLGDRAGGGFRSSRTRSGAGKVKVVSSRSARTCTNHGQSTFNLSRSRLITPAEPVRDYADSSTGSSGETSDYVNATFLKGLPSRYQPGPDQVADRSWGSALSTRFEGDEQSASTSGWWHPDLIRSGEGRTLVNSGNFPPTAHQQAYQQVE